MPRKSIKKRKRVLITGGNGFLGSRTAHELVRRGYELRCLLRSKSKTDRIREIPYEPFLGDIRDRQSLINASQNCDAIVHLAGVSSWAQIRQAQKENQLDEIIIEGTRNVLEAARINKVSRTVYVSSCAAVNASRQKQVFDETAEFSLSDSTLAYSIAKHRAEEVVRSYVENYRLDAVVVNPSEVYGANDQDLITSGNLIAVLKQTPAIVCSGGTSVVHVDDIAIGICLALEKGRSGERYILGGENLTIGNLVKLVRKVANKKGPVIAIPNSVLLGASRWSEKLKLKLPIPQDVLDYAILYWFVDSSKACDELGYRFRPASEIFSEVVQWLIDSNQLA